MALKANRNDTLLLFGYVRNFQQSTKLTHSIPDPIVFIIIKYYATNFQVYCIGNNSENRFEIDDLTNGNLTKYTLSNKISKQCTDISSITAVSSYIIIRNFNTNNIFVTGNNSLDIKHPSITYLHEVDDCDEQKKANTFIQSNDYINVISKGIWSDNCYMVTKKGIFCSNTPASSSLQSFFNKNSISLKSISCGGRYVLFVCSNGAVYSFGANNRGQCGVRTDNNNDTIEYPTLVKFADNNNEIVKIKDISSGSSHNICVTIDGDLFVLGWNSYGQLGVPLSQCKYRDYICVPHLNEFFKCINVDMVECGAWHSVVIDKNGYSYLFGYNSNGQIGDGIGKGNIYKPYLFQYNKQIKEISNASCGYRHTLLLSYDNNEQCIYSFGRNEQRQCSILSGLSVIKKPYKLTKREIGIDSKTDIVGVVACPYATMIITNC